jgi:hypothetical protein
MDAAEGVAVTPSQSAQELHPPAYGSPSCCLPHLLKRVYSSGTSVMCCQWLLPPEYSL